MKLEEARDREVESKILFQYMHGELTDFQLGVECSRLNIDVNQILCKK